ncbi:hypothetical protein N3K66_008180 [Trichothecium roseum]|uniref:Uncharacterized protein n=1 Tax=Trichothecium roseum TaxID=47278 RepID=A0ACC0UT32_9HYPO|nr:hypothetical protein N3K66_008180 [Trichothecium roseum]
MVKRKREAPKTEAVAASTKKQKSTVPARTTTTTDKAHTPAASTPASTTASIPTTAADPNARETIQVVVGTYDGILHGLVASIEPPKPRAKKEKKKSKSKTSKKDEVTGTEGDGEEGRDDEKEDVSFADTFLFHAHTKAMRSVAVSPPSAPLPRQPQKVLLASGDNSGRINSYVLAAHPPSARPRDALLAAVTPRPILESKGNRELGTFDHHSGAVTALAFPSRSKMLSASDDSTIAVMRTRDWALLEPIKVPAAKAYGRPSGDTAPLGGTPSGVNDLAVHPSMRLMISVSKGERSMRLWNLVTGKKAGVLNFDRALLQEAGEGRHATGEGRRVVWGSVGGEDQFAVAFERDAAVFGMDSVPRCRLAPPTLRTKLHQMEFLELSRDDDDDDSAGTTTTTTTTLLAVSTEDGRVLFFSTADDDIRPPAEGQTYGTARLVASLGGRSAGVASRIKDFAVLRSAARPGTLLLAGGCSDGKVHLWRVTESELVAAAESKRMNESKSKGKETETGTEKDGAVAENNVGSLVGVYDTGNRITCLAAFVMIPRPEDVEEEDEEEDEEEEPSDDDDDDGSEDSD